MIFSRPIEIEILERKYQKVTANEMASKQQHLPESESKKLEGMLSKKFSMARLDTILMRRFI